MLSRPLRLHAANDFRETLRQGRRCSTRTISVHARFDDAAPPPRVGFVVNKAVGVAVRRNRVKRRLRAIMHAELVHLPGGRIVVRALPAAAAADFAELTADMTRCLDTLRTEQT